MTGHDAGVRQAERYTYWSVHWGFLILPAVGVLGLLDPRADRTWAAVWLLALCLAAGLGLVVMHTVLRRRGDLSPSGWDRLFRREPLRGYAVGWVLVAVASAGCTSLVLDTGAPLTGAMVGVVASITSLPALALDALRRGREGAGQFRPWLASGCAVVLCLVAVLADAGRDGRWFPVVWVGAFLSIAILALTVSFLNMLSTTQELDRARDTAAHLAVAEERLRFSRDLHDVFGRTLSAVALKSELAAAQAEAGRDDASATMREVQAIAQEALEEVRGVVRGYREADLDSEIAGARALLESAGIEVSTVVDLAGATPAPGAAAEGPVSAPGSVGRTPGSLGHPPGHADDTNHLPAPVGRALAWVVREAATNVLRHSEATQVRIVLTADPGGVLLEIANDGPRPARGRSGAGLTGLTERLVDIGGRLSHGIEQGSFVVRARVEAPSLVRLRAAERSWT